MRKLPIASPLGGSRLARVEVLFFSRKRTRRAHSDQTQSSLRFVCVAFRPTKRQRLARPASRFASHSQPAVSKGHLYSSIWLLGSVCIRILYPCICTHLSIYLLAHEMISCLVPRQAEAKLPKLRAEAARFENTCHLDNNNNIDSRQVRGLFWAETFKLCWRLPIVFIDPYQTRAAIASCTNHWLAWQTAELARPPPATV